MPHSRRNDQPSQLGALMRLTGSLLPLFAVLVTASVWGKKPIKPASRAEATAIIANARKIVTPISMANRWGGSQAVTDANESMPGPKFDLTTTGLPSRSSTSVGTNQAETPGPVVMACQGLQLRLGRSGVQPHLSLHSDVSFLLGLCGRECSTSRQWARPPVADSLW